MDQDIVSLVHAEFHPDLARPVVVLQAEQSSVDLELFHRARRDTIFQVVDPQKVIPESDGVCGPKADRRVEQGLLRRHPISDCIVHVQIERLSGLGELDPHTDKAGSQVVQLATSDSLAVSEICSDQLLIVVPNPVVLACAEKRVQPDEIGMRVEVHLVLPLCCPDK